MLVEFILARLEFKNYEKQVIIHFKHVLKLKFHFETNNPFHSGWKTSSMRWIIMCTLESDLENPLMFTMFTFEFDLKNFVKLQSIDMIFKHIT